MSQSHDPNFDEVKQVLRRIQDLAEPISRVEPPPTLRQRLAALSTSPKQLGGHNPTLGLFASGTGLQDTARDHPTGRGPGLKTIFSAALVGVSAAALALFAGVASIKREIASVRLPESQSSVAMALRPISQSPPGSGPSEANRMDAASDKLAGAPRLVAPAEWTAPAGAATKLPLSFEPQEEARNYQVLISGLEASAFVVKGTEIIAGTWIVPANELANAMITRNANPPRRTMVTVELRAESGEVVSQARAILFAQALTLETGVGTTNR
jgi:hypothetical protein